LIYAKKSVLLQQIFKQMPKTSAIIIPEGCTKVLLHACCAPCSSAIVEWLLAHDVEPVIYYFNPNIYPFEEYEIRKNESKRHAASLGITWYDDDYAHQSWLCAVQGMEHEPERGKRCETCFYHRLLATAKKAQELGIPFFATTLASSRWKNLDQVNAAGMRAEQAILQAKPVLQQSGPTAQRSYSAAVRFWPQNWRKDGLQDRRNALLKEYGFYNQQYCGCEFSLRARQEGR
jgi:hypothetical protein